LARRLHVPRNPDSATEEKYIMATEKLDKASWHAYFDAVSKALTSKRVEIEVQSLALGSQIEADWLPLLGITYEPRADMLEIALEGLDHMIQKPAEIYVEHNVASLSSMEIIDSDGVRQVVRLRDPLMLPAP
jgi:hypothetical protein